MFIFLQIFSNTPSVFFTFAELSFGLLILGLFGAVFTAYNYLYAMLAIELMYIGAILTFVMYAINAGDAAGLVYSLAVLIAAACDSAVGLGLLVTLRRFDSSLEYFSYQILGG